MTVSWWQDIDKILRWGVARIRLAKTEDGFRLLQLDGEDDHRIYLVCLHDTHVYEINTVGECQMTLMSCNEVIKNFSLFFHGH